MLQCAFAPRLNLKISHSDPYILARSHWERTHIWRAQLKVCL